LFRYGRGVLATNNRPERGERRQTACKPGSVQPCGLDGHSSGTRLAARLTRPTRATGRECPGGMVVTIRRSPLFGLAPGGVCRAAPVAGGAVRSCRAVSPLPAGNGFLARAVCSLWHFPWGRPRRPLAGTVFPWSPDFPPPGLPPAAAVQPSGGNSDARLTVWRQPVWCHRPSHIRATASSRARVPASAWPVTASGRQCRWKARSTAASAGSSAPSGTTA